jgi:hypothetical protein
MESSSILRNRLKRLLSKKSARASAKTKKTKSGAGNLALEKLIQKQLSTSLSDIFGKGGANDFSSDAGGSFARQTGAGAGGMGFFDNRQLATSIDQLVAASLMNGKQTSGVMRAIFGLVPGLIGR